MKLNKDMMLITLPGATLQQIKQFKTLLTKRNKAKDEIKVLVNSNATMYRIKKGRIFQVTNKEVDVTEKYKHLKKLIKELDKKQDNFITRLKNLFKKLK